MNQKPTKNNQDKLLKLVSDPSTIAKAVEGSMDKRAKVLGIDNQKPVDDKEGE